jgi:hypothetical protein
MGIRWWLDALRAAWDCVSCKGKFGTVERCPASDWLRRDIGLTEDDMKSLSDRMFEMKRKHGGWF